MSRLPPLSSLIAFEAAVRHQSFTRAAAELHLTHGAISQAVRGLEGRLGVRLFERQGRQIVATDGAHRLAVQLRHGLGVLEQSLIPSARAAAAVLTVSVLPSVAARWLVPELAQFHAANPSITLDLRVSEQITQPGRDGVDAAIRYGPGTWASLQQHKLADEFLFPVCSPRYRDGRLPRTPQDLAECTLLRHAWQPWAPWLSAAGVDLAEPRRGLRCDDSGLILDLAAAGLGIALARASLVGADIRAGRLVRLFDVEVKDRYAYWLVWTVPSARLKHIYALRDWLSGVLWRMQVTRSDPA